MARPKTLLRSLASRVAACETDATVCARTWRRRASEAGARASTSRHSYRSTHMVGAGRAGPIWSASDAVGEQPGLESGGLHRASRAASAFQSQTPP